LLASSGPNISDFGPILGIFGRIGGASWHPNARDLERWHQGANGLDHCLPDCHIATKGAGGARGTRGKLPSMLMIE